MKAVKKINSMLALFVIGLTLIFTVSCKKYPSHAPSFSPWQERSSGVSAAGRYIIEMSEPDQTTCYGIVYDNEGALLHDLTVTHDGGETWHQQTIPGLENNYLYSLAASTANSVHVLGYNYEVGGVNIFRTLDGGKTWRRGAQGTYTDPASFVDDIKFFNPQDGVMFGDPVAGNFEIYTTNNGGNSWCRVSSKHLPVPVEREVGVPFQSDTYLNTMWILTIINDSTHYPTSARLLRSDDKGLHWYVKNHSVTFSGYDCSIKFRNASVGLYKNNEKLYRTTNGGATWRAVNYSGTWFSFDLDNVPGKPGCWISTGGGDVRYPNPNSAKGFGSSITYDDGDHWITLDTKNHTCVDMISPTHGYSGGTSTGNGKDGVFIYKCGPLYQP